MEDLIKTFAIHGALLIGKTLIMAPLTARQRLKNKTFANPEDMKIPRDPKNSKVDFSDPDVERVRRAHQNDLENILPFFVIGGFYLTTQPTLNMAKWLFRIFTASRFSHTLVYLLGIRQPARFLTFVSGMAVNIYMVFSVLSHFWKYL